VSRIRYRVEPDSTGFLRAARFSLTRVARGSAYVRDGLRERVMRSEDLHETRQEAWAAWRASIESTLSGLQDDVERVTEEIERLQGLLDAHDQRRAGR
jgi:hypothetical protein